jgi:hypothetical protein
MPEITGQVHSKFKLFTGPLESGGVDGLAQKLVGFVKESGVAAKSIGAEYLEAAGKLVLTLGYRDDEPGYPVAVRSVKLGKFESLDDASLARLEKGMSDATAGVSGIICHELFITGEREFFMVLMTTA